MAGAQPAVPDQFWAEAGEQEAVLRWTPSDWNVVHYEFRFGARENQLEFNTWAEVPGSSWNTGEHIVAGLANGSRYFFELRAVDDDGPGAAARTSITLAASPSSMVQVPDAQLRMEIERKLGLASGAQITQGDLATVNYLDIETGQVADLAGLEFAVNLVVLDVRGGDIEDVSALAGLTLLERLFLSGNRIADVSALSNLTSLTRLWLDGNGIADVSALSGLTSLSELYLSANKIKDVSALSSLISLTWLWLEDNEISDVSPLSGLTSLADLRLDRNRISNVSVLSNLKSLWELRLDGNKISDVSALSSLTSLRLLHLRSNEIIEVSLSDLTSLWTLELSGNPRITKIQLSNLTSLTSLSVPHSEIVEVSLSGLTSLEFLFLHGNAIENISLSGLASLTDLWLHDNKISDVSGLAGLTSLTTLYLSGNEISDVSALSGLTSLLVLYLSGNEISDMSPLSGLTSLGTLGLSGNEIVDVSALAGLTRLGQLYLSGNEIVDVSPLSGLLWLGTLDLSGNQIADVSALSGLPWLGDLNLSGNEIADVSALAGLVALGQLQLAGNDISDVSALAGLTSLTSLSLSGNEISDVSALASLTSLRSLYLDGNAISDISSLGGWQLGELWFFVLSRNAISDIRPLLESGLQGIGGYVDLRGNPLGDGQAGHVLALRESRTIVVFDDGGHRVPLFPSAAAESAVAGFVRVINHSNEAGSVSIEAVDETGERRGPLSLAIDAGQALHFNAADLEQGNPTKGLSGIGEAIGDWRLVLRSELDIEVLGYARTPDGFLTSLHDLAPEAYGTTLVPTFEPGSNQRQVSRLRVTNPTAWDWRVRIAAQDDAGVARYLSLRTPAHQTLDLTAAQLESGQGLDFGEGIGDGAGRWALAIAAPGQRVMSLLQSPTGHLANVSTGTAVLGDDPDYYSWVRAGGRYRVPLFPAASSETQGLLRIVNLWPDSVAITLRAFDGLGVEREPTILTLRSGEVLHLSSDELESGNADKGMVGIGPGMGDWHLEVSGDRLFEVLAYARTADGFVTSMHDVAPRAEDGSLWIPFFNPGGDPEEATSRLRLVNWGEAAAETTITGVDDAGTPGEAVRAILPAGSARDYTAWELETGQGAGLSGALGDGNGKWRLRVSSPGDIEAMSLLALPTGHITNLSTTPRHPPK